MTALSWKAREALGEVNGCKAILTPEQYAALRAQVRSGDIDGAMQELRDILERRRKGL